MAPREGTFRANSLVLLYYDEAVKAIGPRQVGLYRPLSELIGRLLRPGG
jgi:hypothetical protein